MSYSNNIKNKKNDRRKKENFSSFSERSVRIE